MSGMRLLSCGVPILIVAMAVRSLAAEGRATTLGLEAAVQTALMNNRGLQAAQFTVWKAKGRLAQAGKWMNPELELAGMSDVLFGNKGEGAFSVGVYQTFPLTARLGLAREATRFDVLCALREIRNQERLLIAETQGAYFHALESQARAEALAGLREAAGKTLAFTRQRIEAGQGGLPEQSLALVEERRIWNEGQEARTDAELRTLALKTLLGLEADQPLRLSDSFDTAFAKISTRIPPRPATLHRPDAELLLLEVERAGLEIQLARAEAWSGVRIGVEYTYDQGMDEPEGLGTDHFLGVSVSLPLPLLDAKEGLIEERSAARDEASARLRAARLEMGNAVATALRSVALLKSRIKEFENEVIQPVAQTEKDLDQAFTRGLVDFRDLLVIRHQQANLELELISLRAQLAAALIALESASGGHPSVRREYLVPSSKSKAPRL